MGKNEDKIVAFANGEIKKSVANGVVKFEKIENEDIVLWPRENK